MLSVVEAVGVLLMCFLLVPHPLEPPRLAFDFRLNLEDVAAASVLRAAVISGTYAYGMRRQYLRRVDSLAAGARAPPRGRDLGQLLVSGPLLSRPAAGPRLCAGPARCGMAARCALPLLCDAALSLPL